jgi:5-methylthioadenosine/S-adenosylhomocysteine deaminase
VAIGGAAEQESFEVQAKVRVADAEPVLAALDSGAIEVLHRRRYVEYDTYFSFSDPGQGHLRFREDHICGDDGKPDTVRGRLTLIGPSREDEPLPEVLLSRSRFLAPASHSLRFYREYFKPVREVDVEKERLRWRVLFQGTEFYVNLDEIKRPELGLFLEVKSRTWSRRDAEHKARVARELLRALGASGEDVVTEDYVELAAAAG